MRYLLVFLLFLGNLYAQLAPPTQTTKAKNGDPVKIAWDFTNDQTAAAGLLYFKIQSTYDLNAPPSEIQQAAPADRQANVTAIFTTAHPQFVYYIVSAIYANPKGESFPSNTVSVQRVGPPPQ